MRASQRYPINLLTPSGRPGLPPPLSPRAHRSPRLPSGVLILPALTGPVRASCYAEPGCRHEDMHHPNVMDSSIILSKWNVGASINALLPIDSTRSLHHPQKRGSVALVSASCLFLDLLLSVAQPSPRVSAATRRHSSATLAKSKDRLVLDFSGPKTEERPCLSVE